MEQCGQKASAKFLDALVKSVQSLCHGYLEFQNGIEIVGFINLSVDKEKSVDCILKEKVCKTAENATSFISNSYHAKPVLEETPSGGTSQLGKRTISTVHSSSSNRPSSQSGDADFSHFGRGSLKRKAVDDHGREGCAKKVLTLRNNSTHSSAENLLLSSSVAVASHETEFAEQAGRSSKSPEDMGHVKLTGSGVVLEPVDNQSCAGEESGDFDVTFIKEEFVEEESSACDFNISAGQHVADHFRGDASSSGGLCPMSMVSGIEGTGSLKVEPGEHQYTAVSPSLQPQPGASTGRDWPRSYQQASVPQLLPDCEAHNTRHTSAFPQQTVSHHHDTGHVSKRPHCPVCLLNFSSVWERAQHKCGSLLMKNGQRMCNICGKGITRREDFEDHLNKHRNIKAHACPFCSQPFTYKNNLRQHIRSGVCQKYGSLFFRKK